MVNQQAAYPLQVKAVEDALIQKRRTKTGNVSRSETAGRVGVALTGGGIRSATQSLGHFQEFARAGLLRCFDFMSSVSGGGYFAGFLTKWLWRENIEAVSERLAKGGPEVSYLRHNSNYIAPSGSGDLLLAVAVLLRNWLSLITVMSAWVLAWFCLGRLILSFLPIQAFDLGFVQVSLYATAWVAITAVAAVPLVWAYWLIQSPGAWFGRLALLIFFGTAAVVGALRESVPWLSVSGITLIAALWWIWAKAKSKSPSEQQHILSRYIAKVILLSVALLLWAIIDTVGLLLYQWFADLTLGGLGALASLGTVVAFSRKMISFDAGKGGLLSKLALPLLSFVSVLLWLAVLASAAYLIEADANRWSLLIVTVLLWAVSFAWGNVWAFVNRSSFHPFLTARISRTFLGASNPARIKSGVPVSKALSSDNMEMGSANTVHRGGPIHIIETTINETVDGRSQLQQVHRQGTILSVASHLLSVGSRHHALRNTAHQQFDPVQRGNGYHVFGNKTFSPEPMSLGQWIAISAAAASTGMGYGTSISRSLLFALLNVRMGYWWDSGLLNKPSGLFGVQRYFLREAFALFPGTAKRRWYLTDGAHFENSGAYELIRRRLQIIIVCDGGQDAEYAMFTEGNLIRKVRIDFGADVHFLNNQELYQVLHPTIRPEFGTFEDMKPGDGSFKRMKAALATKDSVRQATLKLEEDDFSLCHAALARITYSDSDEVSWMIWLKPTLTGDESQDVVQYRKLSPSFPHESTADQMFGEDQWESYRALSQHVSKKVFAQLPDANQNNTPFEWVMNGRGPSWKPNE